MFNFIKKAFVIIMLVLMALPMALPADSPFLPPASDLLSRISFAIICTIMIVSLFKSEPLVEKPEPRIEYLLGTPQLVTLFQAYEQYSGCSRSVHGYYSTAANAFAANPKSSVQPVEFYQVGDQYIESIKARLVDLRVDADVPKSKELTA